MKKTTKAIYACVAGLSLLTTTGGTFALWSESAPVAGGTVDTGDLRLDYIDGGRFEWTHTRKGGGSQKAEYLPSVVGPGDRLVGITRIEASLVGGTLAASLVGTHDENDSGNWISGPVKVVLLDGDSEITPDEVFSPGFSASNDAGEVTLRVEITFADPKPAGSDPVELGSVTVRLQQILDTTSSFSVRESQ